MQAANERYLATCQSFLPAFLFNLLKSQATIPLTERYREQRNLNFLEITV
jgi:hypothetical protein